MTLGSSTPAHRYSSSTWLVTPDKSPGSKEVTQGSEILTWGWPHRPQQHHLRVASVTECSTHTPGNWAAPRHTGYKHQCD